MIAERPDHSIGRALFVAAHELRAAGIDSARLDAEVLLGHLVGMSRTQLAIHADQPISVANQTALDILVQRRIAGESVAYLIGAREFMGLEFSVGPGVLVPRPETELLVERAIALIDRHWPGEHVRVLDLCTGSGAIALSLASLTPADRVQVTASDISPDALGWAMRNREALGFQERVTLVEADLFAGLDGPWDLVLTNPPYLTPVQVAGNPDLAAEPRLALDGGEGGLELIARLLDQAVPRAAPRFAMMIEIDPDQADAARALAEAHFPGADVIIVPDLTGRARFVSIERQEHLS